MKLSAAKFSYDKVSKQFISEISSIVGVGVELPLEITLVSTVSQREASFSFVRENLDAEGELVSWEYLGHGSRGYKQLTLVIING